MLACGFPFRSTLGFRWNRFHQQAGKLFGPPPIFVRTTIAISLGLIVACNSAGPMRTGPDGSSYEAAMEQLMRGHYPQATGRFSDAVRHNREDIRAHAGRLLSETYHDPDHPDNYMRVTRAARMGYQDFRLLDLCGRQLYDYSNGDTSILRQSPELFHAALKLEPNNPSSHYYLGLIYIDLGDTLNARKHLSAAAETESDWQDRAIEALTDLKR